MEGLETSYPLLLTLGGVFLLGLVTSTIGRRTFLPRVTLLLLFGVLIGDAGFGLVAAEVSGLFPVVTDMALVMVGFLLGGQLTPAQLHSASAEVLSVSLVAALVTAALVGGGLWALGLPLPVALVLGCIASATDAAAVFDVVQETGSDSRFSRALLAIVALDDVWALVLFSAGMALATAAVGAAGETGFVLAGVSPDVGALAQIGAIGACYLGLRSLGKVAGARLGGFAAGIDGASGRQLGCALLPQAGVAIGMALVAANHLPEYRTLLLTLVISSTVVFEIVGPVFTRRAILRGQLRERAARP